LSAGEITELLSVRLKGSWLKKDIRDCLAGQDSSWG
jgi:hypothetical protein